MCGCECVFCHFPPVLSVLCHILTNSLPKTLGNSLVFTSLALACPTNLVCFVPSTGTPLVVRSAAGAARSTPIMHQGLRTLTPLRKSTLEVGRTCELHANKHGRGLSLTVLHGAKKSKGTAPNNPRKKGRDAYLAAKKALEAQHAACPDGAAADDQPRPGDDDTWTMEEAWEDHTKVLERVMTEAAPDFAASPTVVEVALGAPEKWWKEVVIPRLARIAEAAYDGLTTKHGDLRVLDVGTGTGTMLPHLAAAQPLGIDTKLVAVDLCEAMLDIVEEHFPDVPLINADFSTLTPQDLHRMLDPEDTAAAEETPAQWAASGKGKVDVVVMNAVYSTMLDETDTLEAAARLLRRGGRVVISHPLGRAFVGELQKQVPDLIEHTLPDSHKLDTLTKYLPLTRRTEVVMEEEFYLALLERTPEQLLETVICLRGAVASGWGRGGKKLGVPTANLPESLFPAELRDVPTGVYVGWASVDSSAEAIKAVVNVGYSPTFVGAENAEKVVEAHLFKEFSEDFYGKEMRLMLMGYLRPEAKFASFPLLLSAIQTDLADAKACLDQERFAVLSRHPFLKPDSGLKAWQELPYDSAALAAK